MLGTLDLPGAPLVTQVVSINRADDQLYLSVIDQARSVVGQKGLLYIGDHKIKALSTCVHLVAVGDYF